jgi:molecular chaperone DnaJ
MAKNYYDILGVDKKANKDEVKKAFHKLAHKYHPDKKGGDDAKFKEISEAYSVLSDDKKRAEYDTYGQTFSGAQGAGGQGFGDFDFSGFTGGQGFQNFDFGDLGDIFGDMFGGGRESKPRGRDISIDLELTFEESVFGVTRKVLLTKLGTCDTCTGTGAKKGTDMQTCKTCNGNGKIHETKRSFFGQVSVVRACATCRGSGKIPKEKCATCHGEGVLRKQEELSIQVPAGIDNGEVIRMQGRGEAAQGGASGDLYIKIHVKPHPKLYREGNNLVTELSIKLSDALLGGEYTVASVEGPLKVTVPSSISFGEILRVKGKGVPISKSQRGDLLIKVTIAMPQKLTKSARELVEKLKHEGI